MTWILLIMDTLNYGRIILNYGYLQPLSEFMATCTASGKEVFDAFLLIHYCQRMGRDTAGKIIYQDYQSGMEQDIILDSLIPRHDGIRTPDMSDISLEGTDYKLFSYPFQLGRHRMVICGLKKTDEYNAQLHAIPVGTSYTLIICLVLFLLSLPFLKIFMMNERDRVHALNIFIGVAFLFAMASFIETIVAYPIDPAQPGQEPGKGKPRRTECKAGRLP